MPVLYLEGMCTKKFLPWRLVYCDLHAGSPKAKKRLEWSRGRSCPDSNRGYQNTELEDQNLE
ncbi:predicted protein [Plenodomus lingam JN3]|uniref:Predicted protein n=1 Tax=Leptosphaeria maculans (strain JN3 / isolate v23.1.3 / race Av1-4-5-6-7-8) TaxID=985895 RepID=E4ZXZ9_LEPMJ|nr:predicted protein [Plenodomus lingam JN3]CBX96244.1 predicted protein [Plenodomus lingam JN3]